MTRLRRARTVARLALFALPLVLPLVGGCATSRLVNVWQDPGYKDGALSKVLVIAVRRDPVRRRIWEDSFAQQLQAHGMAAVVSYSLFPEAAPDTQQIIDAARDDGFDSVALSVRLPDVTVTNNVPSYTRTQPVTVYRPMFHGYVTYYQQVLVPGYTETDEMRSFQTDVLTMRNGGRLIWSGTVETIDAPANGAAARAIRDQLMPELVDAGIVPRAR